MAQATISVCIEENDKMEFNNFCFDAGLNTSAAINLFVKAVLRERRVPCKSGFCSDCLLFSA